MKHHEQWDIPQLIVVFVWFKKWWTPQKWVSANTCGTCLVGKCWSIVVWGLDVLSLTDHLQISGIWYCGITVAWTWPRLSGNLTKQLFRHPSETNSKNDINKWYCKNSILSSILVLLSIQAQQKTNPKQIPKQAKPEPTKNLGATFSSHV